MLITGLACLGLFLRHSEPLVSLTPECQLPTSGVRYKGRYAPTTAHTNAECEEYYDELDEHIAEERQNDILIIAADCNANVGNRRSWAKHKPASQMCLGNLEMGGKMSAVSAS
jgi:hypothetical protein